MRRIIPSFVIRPVQALDTPLVRPRAYITLDLAALVPGAAPQPEQIVLDLFEPPVHIKHMPAVMAAKATLPKPSLNRLAKHLRIGRMTVKRALAYAKLMEAAGMTEPYRELHEAPAQASRWKPRKPKDEAA